MSAEALTIAPEEPRAPDSVAMMNALDAAMRHMYDVDGYHFVSPDELVDRGASFFVARVEGRPAGCAAYSPLKTGGGELKRMWTEPDFRRRGVGRALLQAVEAEARRRDAGVLYLETGPFQPEAVALYEGEGFVRRGPFGGYPDHPQSIFMEKNMTAARGNEESAA